MSNNGRFPESGSPAAGANLQKQETAVVAQNSAAPEGARKRMDPFRYPDMQSAARFPIKLPVSVKLKSGESATETQNISANGVLFQVSSEIPVGSLVEFTISLPADVVGSNSDVQIDCRGRVVRSFEEDGRRGVGVVIDEYHFERR
jgi:PilZ domain